MRVREYMRRNGRSPFSEWLNRLDGSVKYRVQARIIGLKDKGHFGLHRQLDETLYELKFKTLGGGLRIYYGTDGDTIVILLCGGNKSSQARDIVLARKYWGDYQSRKEEE